LIKIQDNGIGINKENQFGNGLKNRQKRMEAIGGSFLIANNDKGNGTIVTINLVV
jgi:signal transduction histidine kinase